MTTASPTTLEPRTAAVGFGDLLEPSTQTTRKENHNELHLFAGAGGGILGGMLLGHTCVCAVEIEPHNRKILLARQADGILPMFPIWDDVRTFDGKPWRGLVQTVCGGFPCQDISISNRNAQGINGERSGLWSEMLRVAGEIRPRHIFVENSSALTFRGLGRVIGDLAEAGYDCRWVCLRCADVGGNHYRDRIWILADSEGFHEKTSQESHRARLRGIQAQLGRVSWWKTEPAVCRVDDGLAADVDKRNYAIGNGQVSLVAATAWRILRGELDGSNNRI